MFVLASSTEDRSSWTSDSTNRNVQHHKTRNTGADGLHWLYRFTLQSFANTQWLQVSELQEPWNKTESVFLLKAADSNLLVF